VHRSKKEGMQGSAAELKATQWATPTVPVVGMSTTQYAAGPSSVGHTRKGCFDRGPSDGEKPCSSDASDSSGN